MRGQLKDYIVGYFKEYIGQVYCIIELESGNKMWPLMLIVIIVTNNNDVTYKRSHVVNVSKE